MPKEKIEGGTEEGEMCRWRMLACKVDRVGLLGFLGKACSFDI